MRDRQQSDIEKMETARDLNSDHAPTAEEQLPPLDFKPRPFNTQGNWEQRAECRERQLLAALRENREKDARIAELEKRCNTFMRGLEAEEKDCEALHAKLEAAEAKLRAVSDALEEKPMPTSSFYPDFYRKRDVDALLARIGAIVEGSDRRPKRVG